MPEIIVALDGMEWNAALDVARSLRGLVWGFKVNDLLHSGHYWTPMLKPHGGLMFDPKLHDIPNTMRNTVRQLLARGPDFLTVHASAGPAAVAAAVEAAGTDCKIVAVTVLTSLSDADCVAAFGTPRSITVAKLAQIAAAAGASGIVCAGEDLPFVRETPIIKMCPGVRPDGRLAQDDQKAGGWAGDADFIIVGRPVTSSDDPVAAVEKIKESYGTQTPKQKEN